MAATAGLSLTLDPMGKMIQNASSLKPLGQLKPNCQHVFNSTRDITEITVSVYCILSFADVNRQI
jgi:hypothetical protein